MGAEQFGRMGREMEGGDTGSDGEGVQRTPGERVAAG